MNLACQAILMASNFDAGMPRKAGTDTPFKLPKGESVPVFRFVLFV